MTQYEWQNYQRVGQLPNASRPWMWLVILWLGLLPVAGVCANEPDDAATELEGRWVITSATRDGKAFDNMIGRSIRIRTEPPTNERLDVCLTESFL